MIGLFDILRVHTSDEGTYGTIRQRSNRPFALTMELPDRGNQHDVSCIPTGTYRCRRTTSPKHPSWGLVWEVLDVPDRTKIYLHPANLQSQILGCIAVGEEYDTIGIADSRKGFDEFMALTKAYDELELCISEHYTWEAGNGRSE